MVIENKKIIFLNTLRLLFVFPNVIYSGECFMCWWGECLFFSVGVECSMDVCYVHLVLLDPVYVLVTLSKFLWDHVYICPVVSEKCCFLKLIHHPGILQDLCPLFHTDIWALRGEVWHRYNHLGLTIPKSLILCMFIICRLLYWLQSFTRNFSHEGWVVYLPMGIANFSVEVVLLWFSWILVVGSSLRPMAI